MNKYLIQTIIGLGLLALVAGCDGSGDEPYRDELVLQGFMHVGQPLAVRLTRTIPLGVAYDSTQVGVGDAVVRIAAGTDTFTLAELPNNGQGRGFYAVTDTAVKVIPGQSYAIHAEADGRTLTAQMTATGPVEFLAAGPDTVEYGDRQNYFTIRWSLDSLAVGYAIVIENLEPDWVEDYRRVSGNNGPDMANWLIWVAYPNEDSLRVPWVALGYTGLHRVRILTCNRAAWDYFWTYLPTNVEYDPVTNVQGGFGLFAAGGADTTYFYLKDEINDGPPAE